MINGDGNENGKKNLKKQVKQKQQQKKTLGGALHFFCTFLSSRQNETSYLHVFMKEIL